MTMYGVPYLLVCINCREEFAPIEGNETADFCSWDCEADYEESQEWEDLKNTYNEGFGRKVL